MKINLGLKADLFKEENKEYRFVKQFNWFTRDYGKQSTIIEYCLLLKDIIDPPKLSENLDNAFKFLQEKEVKTISLHYPDEQIPSEVSWIRKTLGEIGRDRLRENEEIPSLNEAQDRFYRTIDIIASKNITPSPILVTHKGGVQLEKEFFSIKSKEELAQLRKEYLNQLLKEHKTILDYCGNKVVLGLENEAPTAWADDEGYLCEQAFEHFKQRLSLGGTYVLDLAHAAVSCYHKHQDKLTLESMKSIESENNPPLNSLEDYIKIAGPYTRLIHLSDAKGPFFSDEGLPAGVEGSIINWPSVIQEIKDKTFEPNIILEIKGSHKDYDGTIGHSLRYLKNKNLIK